MTGLQARHPDERWTGRCARADAGPLLEYDHHVVWIGGRAALLLTYPWSMEGLDAQAEPLAFEVSFTYVRGHPTAPGAVQAIVDRLAFAPTGSGDPSD